MLIVHVFVEVKPGQEKAFKGKPAATD